MDTIRKRASGSADSRPLSAKAIPGGIQDTGEYQMSAIKPVKDRLATLIPKEQSLPFSQVSEIEHASRRWLWATDGHMLVMIASTEEAESSLACPDSIQQLLNEERPYLGIATVKHILDWTGPAERQGFYACSECLGSKICSHCEVGPCSACEATGKEPYYPKPRPGRIVEQEYDRNLIALGIAITATERYTEVRVSFGAAQGHSLSRGVPVWLETTAWAICVMPRSVSEPDCPALVLTK